jgi:hypothetical protein
MADSKGLEGCKSFKPKYYYLKATYDIVDYYSNIQQRYTEQMFIKAPDLLTYLHEHLLREHLLISVQLRPTLTNSKRLSKFRFWPKGCTSLYWEIEAPSPEDIRHFIRVPGIYEEEYVDLTVQKVPEPKPQTLW